MNGVRTAVAHFGGPALAHAAPSPAATYLARLAPGSRRVQAQALDRLAGLLWPHTATGALDAPWATLRYDMAVAVQARLLADLAPATAKRMMVALHQVVTECWRLGLMSAEDKARICDTPTIRAHREPAGRSLSMAQVTSLVAHADVPRDRVLLLVLVCAGLRRAEAVALKVEDVTFHDATHATIRVLGKGNKERRVFLAGRAAIELKAWVGKRWVGSLFDLPGLDSVRHIVSKVARRAGLGHLTPHDLRRTYAGLALDARADLCVVQATMGHSSPVTTSRYDLRGDEPKRKLAESLDIPE